MFSFRYTLPLLLAVITLTQSCSIEKRRYRSGFHIERHSLTRPQSSEKTVLQTDSLDTSVPETIISSDQQSAPERTSRQPDNQTNYKQVSIRESAHVPDTFIVEETRNNTLTPKQRVKYLLKNNQDPEGLSIIPQAETARTFMFLGCATMFFFPLGPALLLASLILLLIAYSKLRNTPEGTYSPDNYMLIRRTFWPAFICFIVPALLIILIIILTI